MVEDRGFVGWWWALLAGRVGWQEGSLTTKLTDCCDGERR